MGYNPLGGTFGGQPTGPSLCGGPLGGSFTGGTLVGPYDVHHHGPDRTTITGGYCVNTGRYFNGYESAMADALGRHRY